jgi:hypothetical protein
MDLPVKYDWCLSFAVVCLWSLIVQPLFPSNSAPIPTNPESLLSEPSSPAPYSRFPTILSPSGAFALLFPSKFVPIPTNLEESHTSEGAHEEPSLTDSPMDDNGTDADTDSSRSNSSGPSSNSCCPVSSKILRCSYAKLQTGLQQFQTICRRNLRGGILQSKTEVLDGRLSS